jgi:hypothetical protein
MRSSAPCASAQSEDSAASNSQRASPSSALTAAGSGVDVACAAGMTIALPPTHTATNRALVARAHALACSVRPGPRRNGWDFRVIR